MHKMSTYKPQTPKSLIKVSPKTKKEVFWNLQEEKKDELSESESDTSEPSEKLSDTLNYSDMFIWLDEFDNTNSLMIFNK